jgi:hypothetical protein
MMSSHIRGWCRFHYRRNQHRIGWIEPRVVWQAFGEGAVASIDELKAKIKKKMLKLNLQHKQTKIIRDVTEFLIESTKSIYLQFLKNGYKL